MGSDSCIDQTRTDQQVELISVQNRGRYIHAIFSKSADVVQSVFNASDINRERADVSEEEISQVILESNQQIRHSSFQILIKTIICYFYCRSERLVYVNCIASS